MSRLLTVAVCAALIGGVAGCSDDGAQVRSDQTAVGGAGSGSLSEQDVGGPAKTKQLQAAVDSYRAYLLSEVTKLRATTKEFTDAVRAGDVAGAKDLYGPSRSGWEGIEAIAGLVPTTAAALDGRAVDFPGGATDPRFTGWHRLEYLLWERGNTVGAAPFANKLDADLATLEAQLKKVPLTPKAIVLGARDLIQKAAVDKTTGEEERYSHTDLWDIAGNIEGAQTVFRVITPVLHAKNATLHSALSRDFATATATVTQYRTPSGAYKPFTVLPAADRTALRTQLVALAQNLSKVVAALGI
jgi:iron uptake system component EfeO